MRIHRLTGKEWGKAIAIGVGVAMLTAAIMLAGLKSGISPLPKPLGLAFAETLFGAKLPLPVGLLFHTVWVTFLSGLYVALFRDNLSFTRALWMAMVLWVLVLTVFFPVVGWGFLGLALTPALIVASAIPHVLFAIFLWGFSKLAFSSWTAEGGRRASTEQGAR